jgi:hypothetical protein
MPPRHRSADSFGGHERPYTNIPRFVDVQVNQNAYDARVRATYKRLIRALGLLSWREICTIESCLAKEQRELIQDGDADPRMTRGNGQYFKVRKVRSSVVTCVLSVLML